MTLTSNPVADRQRSMAKPRAGGARSGRRWVMPLILTVISLIWLFPLLLARLDRVRDQRLVGHGQSSFMAMRR